MSGIDRHEEIERLDRLARQMDAAVRIPGTSIRVGADTLLGLVPGIGDLLALAPAVWIILRARKLGAPPSLIARMSANAGIDTAIGSIPLIGDLFDLGWKGNLRNVRLLRAHVAQTTRDVTPEAGRIDLPDRAEKAAPDE